MTFWQASLYKQKDGEMVNWISNYYHITDDGQYVLRAKQACCGGKYLWSVGRLTALREETIKQGEATDPTSAKYACEQAYLSYLHNKELDNRPKLPISKIVSIQPED